MKDKLWAQNKHWQGEKLTKHIKHRAVFDKIQQLIEPKPIIYLVGPRRIGKSVLAKQTVDYLIHDKHIDPQQILYFEFSSDSTRQDLEHVFKTFQNEIADHTKQLYVFFDEIQYIEDYEIPIKLLYDNEPNVKIFMTGSLSLSYKRKMEESLAGRFFHLRIYPLNFTEYLFISGSKHYDQWHDITRKSSNIVKKGFAQKINPEFKKFLKIGRYPETIFQQENVVPLYLQSILSQNFNQDAINYFGIEKPNLIKSIFEYIKQNCGLEINKDKISKMTGASRVTVSNYLDILELLNIVYVVQSSKNPLLSKSGKMKAYVTSSFFLDAHAKDPISAYGHAVEAYVLERLLEKGLTPSFYRERSKELDFITYQDKQSFEVKFRSSINMSAFDNLLSISKKLSLQPNVVSLSKVGNEAGIHFQPACFF